MVNINDQKCGQKILLMIMNRVLMKLLRQGTAYHITLLRLFLSSSVFSYWVMPQLALIDEMLEGLPIRSSAQELKNEGST